MCKKRGLIFLVSMLALIFSVSLVSAQTEGIPIQKDVFLGAPISGPEDLPEKITFTLYDGQNGLTPLGSQTFPRGQYTVDFEFSHSDGVTGGNVARVKAEFTETLNLKDDLGEPIKPKELWAALEVDGAEVGARTKVSDDTLVRLLLNSDASLATYLTLAYEGDDNPIATIYKDLPISLTSSDGSKKSLSNYFSAVVAGTVGGETRGGLGSLTDPNNWWPSGANIYYAYGNVGIGTSMPAVKLHIDMGGFANTRLSGDNIALRKINYASGSWARSLMKFEEYTGTALTQVGAFGTNNTFGYGFIGKSYDNVAIVWNGSNNVGIKTTNPIYALNVNGTIRCKQLIVDTGWSDFVFEDNYRLPPLREVEQHIQEKGHLPGIPTEAQVKERGVSVGEISSKLLQKIEELTLYVIDINKENESLKAQLANLEAQLKEIKN